IRGRTASARAMHLQPAIAIAATLTAAVTLTLAVRWRGALRAVQLAAESSRHALAAGQQAAHQREALLRAVVETAPVAVVVFADDGEIVFTNAAARQL